MNIKIFEFIHTIYSEILAYSGDSGELCYKVEYKLSNSS